MLHYSVNFELAFNVVSSPWLLSLSISPSWSVFGGIRWIGLLTFVLNFSPNREWTWGRGFCSIRYLCMCVGHVELQGWMIWYGINIISIK